MATADHYKQTVTYLLQGVRPEDVEILEAKTQMCLDGSADDIEIKAKVKIPNGFIQLVIKTKVIATT